MLFAKGLERIFITAGLQVSHTNTGQEHGHGRVPWTKANAALEEINGGGGVAGMGVNPACREQNLRGVRAEA